MQLGATCLHLAVKEGQVDAVRQLMQLNCDLTIRDEVGTATRIDFGQVDSTYIEDLYGAECSYCVYIMSDMCNII